MKKVVCCPVGNLFHLPDERSEVISQVLYGWQVKVLEKEHLFSLVETEDGYRGWMEASLLQSGDVDERLKRAKIKHNAAHLYSTPHVNREKPLLTLPFEVELPVVFEPEEEEGRWVQVQLVTGQLSWIQRGHLWMNPPLIGLNEMLQLSYQFLGLPYTWGGRSSFGYDCSGFMQMLFKQMGVLLPRDASQQIQSHFCSPVDWQAIKPGDLLFFGVHSNAIKHVGLYLGEGQLIHASVKPLPLLQVSSIEEKSLKERFAFRTACRLLVHEKEKGGKS